jgi:predicted enzyme related to lactoylglutathione lyase
MNSICHVEFPAKNYANAKKFYGELFGWQFEEIKEMNYLMFKAPEGVSGAFTVDHKSNQEPGITIYVEVSDMEASIKKAEKLGGKCLTAKTLIPPDMGYYAHLADLDGNRISLWSKS